MKNNDIFKKFPFTNKNIYLQINRTKTYLSDEKNITKEYDTCIAKCKNKFIVAGNKNVKCLNDPISFDWFIENDKITNFNVASFFFKEILSHYHKTNNRFNLFTKYKILATYNPNLTNEDINTFKKAIFSYKRTKSISLIPKPIAEAIGLDINISDTSPKYILSIGFNDITTFSTISENKLSSYTEINIENIYETLRLYFLDKYHIRVSETSTIKLLEALKKQDSYTINAPHRLTGFPLEIIITKTEITIIIQSYLNKLLEQINNKFTKNNPLYLTGESSSIDINMITNYFIENNIYVIVPSNSNEIAINGLIKIANNPLNYDITIK